MWEKPHTISSKEQQLKERNASIKIENFCLVSKERKFTQTEQHGLSTFVPSIGGQI